MNEKIWTREKDGTYSVKGEVEVSQVYMTLLRDGVWSTPYVTYARKAAEDIIQSAISSGKVTAAAYRLTPAKGAEIILEKKRKIMAEVRKSLPSKAAIKVTLGTVNSLYGDKKEPDWVEDFPVKVKEKIKEEKEMPKKEKKVSKTETAEKVGGLFREGTALAYLYEVFEDQKTHSEEKLLAEIKKNFTEKGVKDEKRTLQAQWRIRRFREKGEETGQFALIRDAEEGTLQLKFGKPGAKKAAKPEKKAAKSAKKADKDSDDEAPAAKNGKAAKLVASLLRRTLTEKGEWTKNKLIEHLSEKFQVAEADTRAALKAQVSTGEITLEDGVYELAA